MFSEEERKKKKKRGTMFFSKISIHLCIIMYYIVEENIFVAIVYKLSLQKEWSNVTLKIKLKLIVNKGLSCLRKVNMLDLKILKEK